VQFAIQRVLHDTEGVTEGIRFAIHAPRTLGCSYVTFRKLLNKKATKGSTLLQKGAFFGRAKRGHSGH
jgi:hypothetical protein